MDDTTDDAAFQFIRTYLAFSYEKQIAFLTKKIQRDSNRVRDVYFSMKNLEESINELIKQGQEEYLQHRRQMFEKAKIEWNGLLFERGLNESLFGQPWRKLYPRCPIHVENMWFLPETKDAKMTCVGCDWQKTRQ